MTSAPVAGEGRRSVWRSGLVAPELPTVVFVAVAASTGFWWGLGAGVLTLSAIGVRRRVGGDARYEASRAWRVVLRAVASLAIAAVIAHQTGLAASGVLADVGLDAGVSVTLVASLLARRPLLAVLWSVVHRRPLLAEASCGTRRRYYRTTAVAATALSVRALAIGGLYAAGTPVGWLLGVKLALGLPVTVLVVAAAYAAAP